MQRIRAKITRGRKDFQVSMIRSVNFNRGTMLRMYRPEKTTAVLNTIWPPPKNMRAVMNPMSQMFIYSARNSKVNPYPEYSTLNLLTSSLSPSTKSNGERLSSANITAIQAINIDQNSLKLLLCNS